MLLTPPILDKQKKEKQIKMNNQRLYVLIRACYLREKLDKFIADMFDKEPMSLSVDLLEIISNWIDNFDVDTDLPSLPDDERQSECAVDENIGEKKNKIEKKISVRTPGSVFF